ncbi:MAG: hypothetical protein KDA99_26250, partial [Planctomycetales bacterium]|nr:hypothetical protein [Planctomycetales bacterium]
MISEDPIGFAGGDANLSGYVENSPISSSDPVGLARSWTIDQLRFLYLFLYGEDGEQVLDLFDRAGGTIIADDVWGNWWYSDTKWDPWGGGTTAAPFIWIEEDANIFQAVELLNQALSEGALGSYFVRRGLRDCEVIELRGKLANAQISGAVRSYATAINGLQVAVSIANEPLDIGMSIAEASNGNLFALAGVLPVIPAGWSAVYRKSKKGVWLIDFVEDARHLDDAVIYKFEDHHIWWRMLDGSDNSENLIRMQGHMHRGKGVGLHYYVRQTLGYANNE